MPPKVLVSKALIFFFQEKQSLTDKRDMKKDHLFELFIQRLHRFSDIEESAQDFIRNTAHEYFLKITETAHIPQDHRLGIIEDIEAEIVEMYRKKTYGHSSLKSYRVTINKPKTKPKFW